MCIILLETSFDLNVNVVVVVARICVAENAMMINPLQLWFGSTAVLIRRRRGEGRQNITILGEKCTGQKTCATELSKILEGLAAVDIWFRISDRSMDFHVFALIIVDSTIICGRISYSCVRGTCRKYFFSFFTNVESTQFIIICHTNFYRRNMGRLLILFFTIRSLQRGSCVHFSGYRRARAVARGILSHIAIRSMLFLKNWNVHVMRRHSDDTYMLW